MCAVDVGKCAHRTNEEKEQNVDWRNIVAYAALQKVNKQRKQTKLTLLLKKKRPKKIGENTQTHKHDKITLQIETYVVRRTAIEYGPICCVFVRITPKKKHQKKNRYSAFVLVASHT